MAEIYLRYSVEYDYNSAHVDLYRENGEFQERKSLSRWQIRDYIARLKSVQFSPGKEIYLDPYTNLKFDRPRLEGHIFKLSELRDQIYPGPYISYREKDPIVGP
jgi:hypothetical protein